MTSYQELQQKKLNDPTTKFSLEEFENARREEMKKERPYSADNLEALLRSCFRDKLLFEGVGVSLEEVDVEEETLDLNTNDEPLFLKYSPEDLSSLSWRFFPYDDFEHSITEDDEISRIFSLEDQIKECVDLYKVLVREIYGYVLRRSGEPYFSHIYRMVQAYLYNGFRSLDGVKLLIAHDAIEEIPGIVKRVRDMKLNALPNHFGDRFDFLINSYKRKPFKNLKKDIQGKLNQRLLEESERFVFDRYVRYDAITNLSEKNFHHIVLLTNESEDVNKAQEVYQIAGQDSLAFFCKLFDILDNCKDPQHLSKPGSKEAKYSQLYVARSVLDQLHKENRLSHIFREMGNYNDPDTCYKRIRKRISRSLDHFETFLAENFTTQGLSRLIT